MRLEGANDFGRARRIVERLGLEALEPHQEVLACHEDEIRVARTDTVEVVYVPTNCAFALHGDFSDASVLLVDLATGEESPSVRVSYDVRSDTTTIPQGTYLEDALYVIRL